MLSCEPFCYIYIYNATLCYYTKGGIIDNTNLGGAGKGPDTMRGLFNSHQEAAIGDCLAIVDGFFVRKIEAKGNVIVLNTSVVLFRFSVVRENQRVSQPQWVSTIRRLVIKVDFL
jgi:hypothetical protein